MPAPKDPEANRLWRERIGAAFAGRPKSDAHRQALIDAKKQHNPLKGRTYEDIHGVEKAQELKQLRAQVTAARGNPNSRDSTTNRYWEWRHAVYERDNYTCQDCNKTNLEGKEKQAHHIVSWGEAPDLRFDTDNGVTLCTSCHRKRHAAMEQAFKAGLEIVGKN